MPPESKQFIVDWNNTHLYREIIIVIIYIAFLI